MTAYLDPCDSCRQCPCGARWCENETDACMWCIDDPEVA